jgi:hypothetical protein
MKRANITETPISSKSTVTSPYLKKQLKISAKMAIIILRQIPLVEW